MNQLPRSTSSRQWSGTNVLVEKDSQLELRLVEPGTEGWVSKSGASLRLRLADGSVVPPGGPAWQRALAIAEKREAERVAAWQKVRLARILPLSAPSSRETHAWRNYMYEVRERLGKPDSRAGGYLVAAPEDKDYFVQPDRVSDLIELYDPVESRYDRVWITASPTPDRLATVLVKALRARKPGSMKDARLVFIGTPEQGRQVAAAGRSTGLVVTTVDVTRPFLPGRPLPALPPPGWIDTSNWR